MCGIAGYVSYGKMKNTSLGAVMTHRGPDGGGLYCSTINSSSICLIHNHLSILDLSESGKQPMSLSGGMTHLVYNGEIYNYQTLKSEYLANISFYSETDSEVLLHLFAKYGSDCLHWLNGDFAFAFYDTEKSCIYLVRDRVGVKPLYYRHSDDGLVFGSELKVFRAAGVPMRENVDDLQSYFVFKYYPGNQTPLDGVFRVPPGSYIKYDIPSNSFSLHRYWTVDITENTAISYDDAVHRLREMLSDAVAERLLSDVPVGNFLSGGLDSSAIAYFLKGHDDVEHHCARKSHSDLKMEGTTSDADYAVRLSKEWKLRTHFYDIGLNDADETLIDRTMYYGDDLIADGS